MKAKSRWALGKTGELEIQRHFMHARSGRGNRNHWLGEKRLEGGVYQRKRKEGDGQHEAQAALVMGELKTNAERGTIDTGGRAGLNGKT